MRQRFLNVEHERLGFGEPRRLDHNSLGRNFLDDLVHRRFEFAKQRATNAAAAQFRDPHVFAFNHFCIDSDLAEFIHHNSDLRRIGSENVSEQRRLPAAERAGDKSYRCADHLKNQFGQSSRAERSEVEGSRCKTLK